MSKLLQVFELENKVGYFLHNGKVLQNLDDITFAKSFITSTSTLALCCGAEGAGEPVRWVRFPEFYTTDYFYMNSTYWDAVTFKPKVNIQFHGFGMMANYNRKDVTYNVKWYIDDEQSEVYEIQKAFDDADPEKKWYDISLKDMGVKPVKVNDR